MTERENKTGDKSSDELRLEIAETRAKVAEDVEALGHKLSKDNIKYEAKEAGQEQVRHGAEMVRDRFEDTKRRAYRGVRANPIPYALIGVGVGWLVWSSRQERRRVAGFKGRYGGRYLYKGSPVREVEAGYPYEPYYQDLGEADTRFTEEEGSSVTERARGRLGETAARVQERGAELTEKARGRAQEVGHEVREKAIQAKDSVAKGAHYVRDRARVQATWARDHAQGAWDENPLAIGALALAAGVGIGLLIPSTRSEDRWMGDMRDRFFDRVKQKAHEGVEVASESARQAAETAKVTARKQAEQRGLISGSAQPQQQQQPGPQQQPGQYTPQAQSRPLSQPPPGVQQNRPQSQPPPATQSRPQSQPPPAGQQHTPPFQPPQGPSTQAKTVTTVSVHEVKPVGESQTQVQPQEKPPVTQQRPHNNGGRL